MNELWKIELSKLAKMFLSLMISYARSFFGSQVISEKIPFSFYINIGMVLFYFYFLITTNTDITRSIVNAFYIIPFVVYWNAISEIVSLIIKFIVVYMIHFHSFTGFHNLAMHQNHLAFVFWYVLGSSRVTRGYIMPFPLIEIFIVFIVNLYKFALAEKNKLHMFSKQNTFRNRGISTKTEGGNILSRNACLSQACL